jgi:hypothetical protein
MFPENNCIGIRITYERWNVNPHTLMLLEYVYWWMGSWLLENGTYHVCRRVFILIFFPCRYQDKRKGRKQRWLFTLKTPVLYLCEIDKQLCWMNWFIWIIFELFFSINFLICIIITNPSNYTYNSGFARGD